MQKRVVSFSVLAMLVVLSIPAQAGVISFATTTPIPSTATDWAGSLSFPQFDPSQGTLTSVRLMLTGQYNTVITVTNLGSDPSSGSARTEVQFMVVDAGGYLVTPALDLWSPGYLYDLQAFGSSTSGEIHKSGNSDDLYAFAGVLAEFTGTGNIMLAASTFTTAAAVGSGSGSVASQLTNASLTGTVEYTFTESAIPEPGTMALLAPALICIGLWCRRRSAVRRDWHLLSDGFR